MELLIKSGNWFKEPSIILCGHKITGNNLMLAKVKIDYILKRTNHDYNSEQLLRCLDKGSHQESAEHQEPSVLPEIQPGVGAQTGLSSEAKIYYLVNQ